MKQTIMMRRRVKAIVNLTTTKRKSKSKSILNPSSIVECNGSVESKTLVPKLEPANPSEPDLVPDQAADTNEEFQTNFFANQPAAVKDPVETIAENDRWEQDNVAFKMPVQYCPAIFDDQCDAEIEDNVIQMDLQKTVNGYPMSPSKLRQRIRATPVIGQQRRNSLVCASPHNNTDVEVCFSVDNIGNTTIVGSNPDFASPGTPQKRELYLSSLPNTGAIPQMPTAAHKCFPMSPVAMGRIRTESTCSNISDTFSISGKCRKADDPRQYYRVNTRRDFEMRFNKGVPDKSQFKMFDLIYYNPPTNPMNRKPIIKPVKCEASVPNVKEESNNAVKRMPVPQLKLDENGDMIIDEKSLEIETSAEQEAREVLANSSLIYLDENIGMNGFYNRKKRTKMWTAVETLRFYRCLQIIGTDFSSMCGLFPNRTRRDLKLKYKREVRENHKLITKAYLYPKTFNINELKVKLEKEDMAREEFERNLKAIQSRNVEGYIKKSRPAKSRTAANLKDGDFVHKNELVVRKKMGKHALSKIKTDKEITNNTNENKEQKKQNKKTTQAIPPLKIKQEEKIKVENNQYNQTEFIYNDNDVSRSEIQEELNELLAPIINEPVEELTMEQDANANNYENNENETIINMSDGNYSVSYISETDIIDDNALLPNDSNPDESIWPANVAVETEGSELYTEVLTDGANILYDNLDDDISVDEIHALLTQLSEGSLVLASTVDPENNDKYINQIYMVDKVAGIIIDGALPIPQNIIEAIVNFTN